MRLIYENVDIEQVRCDRVIVGNTSNIFPHLQTFLQDIVLVGAKLQPG